MMSIIRRASHAASASATASSFVPRRLSCRGEYRRQEVAAVSEHHAPTRRSFVYALTYLRRTTIYISHLLPVDENFILSRMQAKNDCP